LAKRTWTCRFRRLEQAATFEPSVSAKSPFAIPSPCPYWLILVLLLNAVIYFNLALAEREMAERMEEKETWMNNINRLNKEMTQINNTIVSQTSLFES
jgi:hypothetical protein